MAVHHQPFDRDLADASQDAIREIPRPQSYLQPRRRDALLKKRQRLAHQRSSSASTLARKNSKIVKTAKPSKSSGRVLKRGQKKTCAR
jgi:hypothetical protein